ncbi:50S ribosomal protein L29 [Spiroplasma turonicum]|uniref:Large ribosomal subunit protein uL29 n=1 Tax=Spiroplasma turonicum TaxID=216946 RepID=A0A0K1P7H1_9MOLU|nr:50S ribosomal protein L29 [Spiroplasma turonicum]AKU80261.1 50S ribosomal protein L29 [Spiroplasma turonicum]ALX71262.1 50S ribosomal protein L29 [Spiroplasma turonicum]
MSKSADFLMELKTKKVEDLIKLSEDRRAELFALKFQAAIGSLEQTHKIKDLKKDIARIQLLLGERKKSGEQVEKIVVKPDYTKAVENAEKAGKEVRKKQRELLEKMQQEQNAGSEQSQLSEDAILAAMNAAVDESEEKEVKKATSEKEVKKATEKKATTKKDVSKTSATDVKKTSSKPSATKKEEAVIEPVLTKEAAKKTGKASSKTKTASEDLELHQIDTSEAKGTGKGKAAFKEVKPKTVKVGTVKAENVEAIDLKLSSKPKDAKTYTFGSNAEEAKKQIAEANKKLASKKTTTKTTSDDKPKKTTTKKGDN